MKYKNLPIAIQCVPEREARVTQMVAELTNMGFENIITFYDYDHIGMIWNRKRILNHDYGTDGDYVLVLQDDLLFAENFQYHLENLVDIKYPVISLFCPPRKYYEAEAEIGTRLYREKNFLWDQAMLFRKDYRQGLFNYEFSESELKEIAGKHIDVMISVYSKNTKQYVAITIPAIVQHDLEIKSSIGTGAKIGKNKRESRLFYSVPPDYFKQS